MQFERNLVLLRKKNNLSQEELAFAVGVARQTIYSWEAGLNYPNIVMLKKLADVLGATTDDLLHGFEVNGLPKIVKNLKLTYVKEHDGVVKYEELPNWFIKLKPEEEVCWALYDLKGAELVKDYSYHVCTKGNVIIHDLEGIEIEVKEYDESLSLSRVYSQFISLKDDGVAWIGETSFVDDKKVIKTYKDQEFLDNWGIDGKLIYQKMKYQKAEDYLLEYDGKKQKVIKISYYDSEGSEDSKKVYFESFLNQNLETVVWRRYTKLSFKSNTTGKAIKIGKTEYDLDYYVLTNRLG